VQAALNPGIHCTPVLSQRQRRDTRRRERRGRARAGRTGFSHFPHSRRRSGWRVRSRQWTLIINKETGQFYLNYNAGLDFGRTKMNLKALATPKEVEDLLKVTLPSA
jgi:hypothetical protein